MYVLSDAEFERKLANVMLLKDLDVSEEYCNIEPS